MTNKSPLNDIVLAVSEAVSNVIEHASLHQPPGIVHIRGQIEPTPGGQRQVTIVVRDQGAGGHHQAMTKTAAAAFRSCADAWTP
ncbi:MAG: ATP-binding protein [Pseudonocardiales bacterium]|nr:ATP-binding protein [Pseudonocardiales bacterium]